MAWAAQGEWVKLARSPRVHLISKLLFFVLNLIDVATVRPRVFIVAYRLELVRWVAPWTLSSFVSALKSRPTLTAGDYYYLDLPKDVLSASKVSWMAWHAVTSY